MTQPVESLGFRLSRQQASMLALESKLARKLSTHADVDWHGPLDEQRLRRSLERLSARHEILRTVFRQVAGMSEPVQSIEAGPTYTLEVFADERADAPSLARARAALERAAGVEAGPVLVAALIAPHSQAPKLLFRVPVCSFDEWTAEALVRELLTDYLQPETGAGDESDVLQYVDYSEWQHEFLESELGREGTAFWRTALASQATSRRLPFEARQATDLETDAYALASASLLSSLTALERALDASRCDVLFFLWSAFLSRVADAPDVSVALVSDRKRGELQGVLGRFAKRLPIACAFQPERSLVENFRELQVRLQQSIAFEECLSESHRGAPGDELAADWGLLALKYRSAAGGGGTSSRITVVEPQLERLRLECDDASDACKLRIGYMTSLFSRLTIETWAEQFQVFVRNCARDVAQPLARVSLLGEPERRRLLDELAATPLPAAAPDLTLHALLQRQIALAPDAIAVVQGDTALSYGELGRRARQLADQLRARGVGADEVVGIYLERSPQVLVAVLGVLQAGAAYLPLDPSYPSERLALMIEDSGVRRVIVDRDASTLLPLDSSIEAIGVEPGAPLWRALDLPPTAADVSSASLAYVIYTSGSTGRPKGVMVSHRNAVSSTHARAVFYRERVERFLLLSSFSFDSSVAGMFWSLSQGGSLVLPEPAEQRDPGAIGALVSRSRITHLLALPSLYLQVLDSLDNAALRCVIVAGEACPDTLPQRHLEQLPGAVLANEYGPTEGSVWCTAAELSAQPTAAISIGRPVGAMRSYVLDEGFDPVAIGAVGELCIGGPGLARGYRARPSITADRFVPNPFGACGERLYRTGDRVRFRPDGQLDYLGRFDQQVKLRGHRIELGELEFQALSNAHVAEAVALVREDRVGDQRLVLYVVVRDADAATVIAAMRGELEGKLPEPMLPNHIVALPALPLGPNGKLAREALPPPAALEARPEFREPQGELARAIAAIWEDVLAAQRIGADDDFFQLGGHSLLVTKITARLHASRGVNPPVRLLFEHTTLEAFSVAVAGLITTEAPAPIARAPRDRALPLSLAQQRLWFLDRLDQAAGAAYHVDAGVRMRGELDVAALRRTLDTLVMRHEILRTTFVLEQDEPRQVIGPVEQGFALHELDLRDSPKHTHDERLAALTQAERVRRFDLAHGPLIRGQLIRLADDEHVLLVTQHHIISDGWSVGVLIREVSALYAAFAEGRPDPLPALEVQYADYASWQRSQSNAHTLQAQVSFWREHLQGAPELLELPSDRPRPAAQSYVGSSFSLALNADLTERLHALGRRHGASLFMTLMAGWAALLSRLSGQAEIVIGTPVANRQRPEVEGLLGLFLNTLALRVQVGPDVSVTQLLAQVRETLLGAYAHQDVPFEQVVETLNPRRSASHSPIFQTLLSLDNTRDGVELQLPNLTLSALGSQQTTAQFDLMLSLLETSDGIRGSISYATDLFDRTTIERWAGHFQRLLEHMARDEQAELGALTLLSRPQREWLLRDLNATVRDYPRDRLVHELIEAAAVHDRNTIALDDGQERLSYAELELRANQLAHFLLQLGVVPDARVAVCVQRGNAAVVALLAVFKAGGAYVPLDPASPRERLDYLLRDSAPVVVLHDAVGAAALGGVLHVPRFDLRRDAARWRALSEERPRVPGLTADKLAYVIYTSGSTGAPKGVMVEHRALVNYTLEAQRWFELHAGDRVLQQNSLNFDLSLEEILPALAAGATLLPRQEPLGVGVPTSASVLHLTAAHFHSLVGQWNERIDVVKSDLQGVRLINVTGDALSPAKLAQWEALGLATRLINTYGPTEVTVSCSAAYVRHAAEMSRVSIGKPFANTNIYVLDAFGEPVPLGVSGEIFIGGAQVARGYLNKPDLTAERFIQDPFVLGARMYKTGDLARYRADGTLEFIGRNDFQVKVRGFRVELGEIESKLQACAGVRDAVVLARASEREEKQLVAYVIAEADCAITPETLRSELSKLLPEYMLPTLFVELQEFPLTGNGKLDRAALPEPNVAAQLTQAYEPPQTSLETSVAEIWRDVLKVERVGRADDFFALGGHSLLAIKLIARLRQDLDVEVPLSELFSASTLQGFSTVVEAASQGDARPLQRIERNVEGLYPTSLGQQRLWFLDQLDKAAGAAYHTGAALRLQGALDVAALRRTLDRLVVRHEILRTTFVQLNDEVLQKVGPEATAFALRQRDLSDLPANAREQAVRTLVNQEIHERMDLSTGPLIRGQLLRLADDEHVLVVVQHHIITDGWSEGLLIGEVSALYSAFAAGSPDPLPTPALQYLDYASWQRGWLSDEAVFDQLMFWRSHLCDAPALLELPSDRPRAAEQNYAGSSVDISMDAGLVAALRSLSERHGSTLFMTLLAGWSLLMSRLSGSDDIVVGVPIASRQRAETESMLGFFVNTLAVRVHTQPDQDLTQLLAQTRKTLLDAYAHQDVAFEQVVEAVNPVRRMSQSPIFQVMLSLNNTPREASLELPGLTLAPLDAQDGTSQFDLVMSLVETAATVEGTLSYSTDLFDRETVERWARHFLQLLTELVTKPVETKLQALEVLSRDERRALVSGLNNTDVAYPRDVCVHTLIAKRAAAYPDAIAVVYDSHALSYRALDERSNQLANRLLARGVQAESCVAISMDRSVELVIGLLGILKAGCAYVPLDPAYPAERLAYMLGDAQADLLLTCGLQWQSSELPDLEVIDLDRSDWRKESTRAPAVNVDSRQLAYTIYTSGSTGAPKGAMNSHAALMNRLHWIQGLYPASNIDTFIQKTSISFDVSVWEFFWPLMLGARLVLPRSGVHRDAAELAAVMGREHVTMAHFVPSMLESFATRDSAAQCGALRRVICSGEALSASLAQRFHALFDAKLLNLYGPTEAAIDVSHWPCDADSRAPTIPIGHPAANTSLYVLDTNLQPVPRGVVGEVYIGGMQVGRGYLRRPGLTASRFVPDPWSKTPGARMYRTGDLGRIGNQGGAIEYVGRNDFQVKIRGYRIELGEIEALLHQRADIRDAVVLAKQLNSDTRLVAYVIVEPGAVFDARSLRSQLSAALPEYMIPNAFIELSEFPVTGNGKLDRAALPDADVSGSLSATYVVPHSGIEQIVAALWQDVLAVDRVGRSDNFFELGGHSLLATQMIGRLRQLLGIEVPLRALFEAASLQGFCATFAPGSRTETISIERRERRDGALYPASLGQQRLWFLDQLDDGAGAAYQMLGGLRLRGNLNVDALRKALNALVARHEILRSTFVHQGNEVWQKLDSTDQTFCLTEYDCRDRPHSCVAEHARTESQERCDLSRGPLIRGRLLRLQDAEHVLLVTQHHIITDAWSEAVVLREVSTLYTAFADGRENPLRELPIQYLDYAAWQRSWLDDKTLQAQLGFWREHLRGAPTLLELPTDRPRPALQSHAGATVELTLSAELTRALHVLSQRYGTTLYMTLMAAWAVLLSRLSGQADVVIGMPIANRRHPDTEALIGFFVNTLALRVRADRHASIAQLLKQVRETLLDAYANQDAPFEQVVELLAVPRSMSHSPVFQTMLSLDNTPTAAGQELPGLTLSPLDTQDATTQFDLVLSLAASGDAVSGTLNYATDLFDGETVERWARHFVCLLTELVTQPVDTALRALQILSSDERNALVVGLNDTDVAYSRDVCIHTLIAERAAEHADAIAVVYEAHALSYRALDELSNQLANHLLARGVRPEACVAISLERSVELVIGLLGILKAGCAYVPLDPAYPAERLAYMLSDAQVDFVVTRGVRGLSPALPKLEVVDLDRPDWRSESTRAPCADVDPRQLAYTIYTSGSTGVPKGAMNSHEALMNRLRWTQALYPVSSTDTVIQKTSISFDVSVWEFFWPLMLGARLVLPRPGVHRDAAELAAVMGREHVTMAHFVPSMLENFATHESAVLCGALRRVVCSGEALGAALAQRFHALFDAELVNLYGPTEAAIEVSHWRCEAHSQAVAIPIGVPGANTSLYVLDPNLDPAPRGVVGEIYIGGIQVSRGYLRRPGLTASRFVPDPWSKTPGARMYRTGDLGRIGNQGGAIEYVGRNDFQVKIRGYRIELGEIETKLQACIGVREAVVLARESRGDKRLTAYVIMQPSAACDAQALRSQLAAALPEYMIPSTFVELLELPVTSNGKLDRAALPAPADATASQAYVAPQPGIEWLLAEIWRAVLGRERVGRNDDFFELGGHSLLVVRMIGMLRDTHGLRLSVSEAFDHPRLCDQAARIGSAQRSCLTPFRPEGSATPLFVVHSGRADANYGRLLLPYLAGDVPVYGISPIGLGEGEQPLTTIERMAEFYIELMRQAQPHGPYRLLGHSLGGTLAYEMAQQLRALGERVEQVLMLDTFAQSVDPDETLPSEVQYVLVFLRNYYADYVTPETVAAIEGARDFQEASELLRAAGFVHSAEDVSVLQRQFAVRYGFELAEHAYVPKPLGVPTTLFVARAEVASSSDRGWRALIGDELQLVEVDGDHHSMLAAANLPKLGAEVSNALTASVGTGRARIR